MKSLVPAASANDRATSSATAFTLVELLLVMALIGLLIGILLPVMAGARESARRAVCLSNLRQLHDALTCYAIGEADQVPLGYRTASEQYNSMIYSATASHWVLFGLLYQHGDASDPPMFFCPSETNAKFAFNTPDNPWPIANATPAANIQSGYGDRPEYQIPDDLTLPPVPPQTLVLPHLSDFGNQAILADLLSGRSRILERHVTGANVLYGDGSAHWVSLPVFDQPAAAWPDPTLPPTPTYNATLDAVWAALDGVY